VFIGDHKSPIFGFLGWARGDKRASRAPTPTRHLRAFCCKQRLLRQSTLGRPLRGPWVAQASPNPKPNPNQAEGRRFTKYQLPLTKYRFCQRSSPRRLGSGLKKHFYSKRVISYFVRFCQITLKFTEVRPPAVEEASG
jgi:hypothetical protein